MKKHDVSALHEEAMTVKEANDQKLTNVLFSSTKFLYIFFRKSFGPEYLFRRLRSKGLVTSLLLSCFDGAPITESALVEQQPASVMKALSTRSSALYEVNDAELS